MQHHTNTIIFISFVRRVFRIRTSRQGVRADSSVWGVGCLSFCTWVRWSLLEGHRTFWRSLRQFGDFSPCHISLKERCEISAVASQEKELYRSVARASASHYVAFPQCGRVEATFWEEKKNWETTREEQKDDKIWKMRVCLYLEFRCCQLYIHLEHAHKLRSALKKKKKRALKPQRGCWDA